MIRKSLFALLLLTALLPIRAQAAPLGVHWTSCTIHLDWATMRHVTAKECAHYRMPKAPGRSIGHWTQLRYVSPHVRAWVKYPEFATPAPARTEAVSGWRFYGIVHVTGYCLTGTMASNQPVYYGAVANNTLPFGTRVSIPSLGYVGSVEDHGDLGMGATGIDVWEPSCAATYALTGYRAVYIN